MKKYFLDTNILMDFLMDRKPHSAFAALLLDAAEKGKIKLFVSAISFNNIYYIVEQVNGHKKTIELLEQLESMVGTVHTSDKILKLAMKSNFKDFEDAIQNFSAEQVKGLDAIVTRNPKDFKLSTIPVILPDLAAGGL